MKDTTTLKSTANNKKKDLVRNCNQRGINISTVDKKPNTQYTNEDGPTQIQAKKKCRLVYFLVWQLEFETKQHQIIDEENARAGKKVVKDERTNERIKRAFYEEHKRKKGRKLKKNIEKKNYYEMRDEVR